MANWTGNPYIDSLLLGVKWQNHNITYKFDNSGSTWTAIEKNAMTTALNAWAAVANITFTETTGTANLNEKLEYNPSNPGALAAHGVYINYGSSGIGQISSSSTLTGTYNWAGYGWDWADPNGGLSKGGFGYLTIVHEIGHALGLDHTHQWSEQGDPHWFPGVVGDPQTDVGTWGLNQDIYSVMSYVNGVWSKPVGLNGHSYGYVAGPMAFDIAAIQFLYGAKAANTGDNVYLLPSTNATGTYWTCIWDTGGTDTIVHNGSNASYINLTAATLDASFYGGGGRSYADMIYGGFTVANGVVIENATGGFGSDTLVGNAANNILRGRDGSDMLYGNEGSDTLYGDADGDFLYGGDNNDYLLGGAGADSFDGGNGIDRVQYSDSTVGLTVDLQNSGNNTGIAAGDTFISIENLHGSGFADTLRGDGNANVIWGWNGNDSILGRGGSDTLSGGEGNDFMVGGLGADVLDGGNGVDRVQYNESTSGVRVDLLNAAVNTGEAAGDTFISIENLYGSNFDDDLRGTDGANVITGANGRDWLYGRGGSDTLIGGDGNDVLVGGLGNDTLDGGAGLDRFMFETALNGSTNVDTIVNFSAVDDVIWLENAFFSGLTVTGNLSSAAFFVGSAAGDSSDRIIYNSATGALLYDEDGTGGIAAIQFAILSAGLGITQSDFVVV